jgi:hypothetical protein
MPSESIEIANAYAAQQASLKHLFLRHALFKIEHQRWFRFSRERPLILALDINTDGQRIGLFAELIWAVYAIHYAETIGALPLIRVTSNTYSAAVGDASDYLRQYFDPAWHDLGLVDAYTIHKQVSSLEQLPRFRQRTQGLTLWNVNEIVHRWLPVKPGIEAEVSAFIADKLQSNYLALHWRGTDKHLEAPPVSAASIVDTIRRIYDSMANKPACLFIATDQTDLLTEVVEIVSQLMPSLTCVCRDQVMRSKDGSPVHLQAGLSPQERADMGRDAMIDALILSRSRALVRTASYLSAWASIWNPVLPVFMVNAPHPRTCWFPDSEIIFASRYHQRRLATDAAIQA